MNTMFSCEFCKSFQNSFLWNACERLLLARMSVLLLGRFLLFIQNIVNALQLTTRGIVLKAKN